jgi:hypothetical protein
LASPQPSTHTLRTPIQSPPTVESSGLVPLSPGEGYFWRREERWPGYHRITAVFRLDGFIEEGIFSSAVDHLQQRHPKLRAEIVRGPGGRLQYRSGGPAPPIRREIKNYEGQECPWREEGRRLFQIPITATGPFILITVFRNRERNKSVLIISTHHGIADGISAMMLGDDLLTEYGRIEAQSSMPARPALSLATMPRVPQRAGWRNRWWLLRRFIRLRLEERRARQTLLPESPQLHPVPQWEHWCFSPEQTSTIVQRCHEEKASLIGAFVSAVYCSLMKCLSDSEALFKWQVPFSLRQWAGGPAGKISPYDVGCFVGIMNEFHRVTKQTEFWDLARSVSASVKGFVHNGGPSMAYNLTALGEKRMPAQTASGAAPSEGLRPTLLATNYGNVSMAGMYGSLRTREVITTFNNFLFGSSLALAALTVGGRLNVGFAAGNLEPAFWRRLHGEVRGRLDAVTSPAERG